MERVLDSLSNAFPEFTKLDVACNGRPSNGKVNNLRDGEEPDQDRDNRQTVPQVELSEGETENSRLSVLAHQGDHESECPAHQSKQKTPFPVTAQCGDAGQPQDEQHEHLRRTEGQDQGTNNRNRKSQIARTKEGPDQGTHQDRPQGPPGLSLFGHWVTIDNRGHGRRLARNSKEDRGNIPGRRNNRVHPEKKGERLLWSHLINKRQHKRQCRASPKPWQDPHPEADSASYKHVEKGVKLQVDEQPADNSIPHH